METITRVFEFDSAHRVMNETVKCFNLHGHRFKVELTFEYFRKEKIGYALDFKEIKRVAGRWLDESFDHACIVNPLDILIINLCQGNGWRLYIMGLGHREDINPSAENMAEEIFYCINLLFANREDLHLKHVRLYETPNCWVDVDGSSIEATDEVKRDIIEWRDRLGIMNYDSRKE